MPLFSVIIPAHNAERTLADTLACVIRQTCGDWEAIVIDDGSTDDTLAVAARFVREDPRVRVVRLAQGGPARARNIGALVEATGAFLAFLDADDIWTDDKLEISAAVLAMRPTVDGVFGQVSFFRQQPSDGDTVSHVRRGVLQVGDVVGENPVCTLSNLVVRRAGFQAIGGFDETLRHAEDLECLVRLVAARVRIASIQRVLVHYRTSPGGLSADLEAMHEGWRKVADTARRLDSDLDADELRAAEAVHLRYLARRALRVQGPRLRALRLALRAIRLSPDAFFNPLQRGVPTLVAALVEPLLPGALRQRLAAI